MQYAVMYTGCQIYFDSKFSCATIFEHKHLPAQSLELLAMIQRTECLDQPSKRKTLGEQLYVEH